MDGKPGEAAIEVIPMGAALGAEIRGVDVTQMDARTFEGIRGALYEHKVVVIRGQELDDPQLIAFARFFGEIDLPRKTRIDNDPWIPEFPEIINISNLKDESGKPLGALGDGEAYWHADMTYLDDVPLASLLYAIEVPDEGGETGFSNQIQAFDELPPDLAERIEGRTLVHDHVHNATGAVTPNWEEQDSPEETPGARHPVAVTHYATGLKHLLLGRRPYAYIEGLELDESEALLDALWSHATQEKFAWHHSWKPGDLMIWDNWATMHHRNPFDENARRIMHRTQIKGLRPC